MCASSAGRCASPLLALLVLTANPAAAGDGQRAGVSAQVFADKALEHYYSLEYDQAIAAYRKSLELDPENPRFWANLGDSYLFEHLSRAGRLDTQLYTASNEFLRVKPVEADPKLVKAMWDALGRARSICEKRLRVNPDDAGAHYALGLAYAVEANYYLNVARRYWDALRTGTKAKEHHLRVRKIDGGNHDANLLIGVHEYAVASVPASVRWILYLAGYSGSKERGVELVQDAMLRGKRSSPAALMILALIYNREGFPAYSRETLQHMLRFFPRNYLVEMEIGATYAREKNFDAAIEAYKNVARKMEAQAPGYARVDADRLYFQIASLLERSARGSEALAYYQKMVKQEDATGALHAQGYLRMGEIYLAMRERDRAREMYEKARSLPFPDIQRQAAARLRAM